jgi:large conductance mechanosensitive channel
VIKEFKEFISKGNVVDLAVAVIIGAAFALIVQAFVKSLLMPLIAAIFGKNPSFDDYVVTINNTPIQYGSLLTAIVNFLIIAFALFLIVKAINRFQAMRKSEEEKEEEVEEEVELLREIRDLLAADASSSSPTR